jgi:hypothetical protein
MGVTEPICKVPKWLAGKEGNFRPSLSTQTRNLPVLEMAVPFPVLAPITSTVLFWIPLQEIFHLVRCPNRQSAITGTGRDSFRTISGTGLCHFRYGHSLGAVPKLGSMRVVPFPELGYASSGTVIHWAPYQNWTLCAWSHFRDGALPVPVRSFTGSRTKTGLYARWVRPLVGLWFDGEGATDDDVDDDGDGATGDDDDDHGDGATGCDNEDECATSNDNDDDGDGATGDDVDDDGDGATGDDVDDDGYGATGDDDDDDGDSATGCDNEDECATGNDKDDDGDGATGDEVDDDGDGATGDDVDNDGDGATGDDDDDGDGATGCDNEDDGDGRRRATKSPFILEAQ